MGSAMYFIILRHFRELQREARLLSNHLHSIHNHREYMIHPIPFTDQLN